jgi:hypothetical protein
MRGFRNQLKKELRVGLNPSKVPMRNGGALTESMNIRCTNEGIEGYVPQIAPFPIVDDLGNPGTALDHKLDWPFPQLYLGAGSIWVGRRAGLDVMVWDNGNKKWTGSAYLGTTNGSWPWTFLELPGYFFCMVSGDVLYAYLPAITTLVQYDPTNGMYDSSGEWQVTSSEGNPLSACLFRGQILMAGNRVGDLFNTVPDFECKAIRWSAIGSFRFLGTSDGGEVREIPDAGFLIVPGHKECRVWRLLPLRDHVIAYCSDRIVALTPAASPTPTFKITNLAPIGIIGVTNPAGNEDMHTFVDRYGALWTIDNNLKLEKYGYENIFGDLQGYRPQYIPLPTPTPFSAPYWDEMQPSGQTYHIGDIVDDGYGNFFICVAEHKSYTAPDKSWMPGNEMHPPYEWPVGSGIFFNEVWTTYVPPAQGAGYLGSIGMLHSVYNPVEQETYISDGIRSFIFSKDKMLTETSRCVTSLFDVRATWVEDFQKIDSHTVGFWKETGEQWAYFATDILDFNNAMGKTIESVEIGGSIPDDAIIEMCIDWRAHKKQPWRRTDWKRVNPKGVGTPLVSGVEMRVCVRVRPFDGFVVDTLNIGWKQSDKSQIRGSYAVTNAPSADAGS